METAVEINGIKKFYNGKVKALDGIDLRVGAGKVFAVLGPNGAGKTTLMRILTTQIKPTSGDASIFGLDVMKDDSETRKLISYVPQEMSVWTDISGYENLLIYAKIYGIPAGERKKLINGMLRTMGIESFAGSLVRNYSGGMIRRLEIACALIIKPKILFLDEPTIGLDPSARKTVWEKLMSFKDENGVTIFFNTHYMDEADIYSDQIAIMNAGKIVKLGTAQELKHSLGGEIISFGIEGKISAGAVKKIRGIKIVTGATADENGLRVFASDAGVALPRITDILEKGGVYIKEVSIKKPTLDDVFLKYAGTKIETAERVTDIRYTRDRIKR
ncbi:MAG: ATP-binding cassette domain-containing protein [Candidatus Aenigmarchaeota archaeon]|nr:ATP-binding cassette domain-containing protein [Candidatus Aenigmarchaeota archaeon]